MAGIISGESQQLAQLRKYSDEELEAGIEEFEKFGVGNILNAVAQWEGTTWQQVWLQPNSLVHAKRMYMAQERVYQENYTAIMKLKNQQ